jgi:hypothetical protein
MSSPPWDYIAKLVCIGDSGTGKSSVSFNNSYILLLEIVTEQNPTSSQSDFAKVALQTHMM